MLHGLDNRCAVAEVAAAVEEDDAGGTGGIVGRAQKRADEEVRSARLTDAVAGLPPWAQDLLGSCFRIDQDNGEQVLERAGEVLHHQLLQLRAGMTRAGFDRRNVVLADAQLMGQLSLRQAAMLTHGFEANGANFDLH